MFSGCQPSTSPALPTTWAPVWPRAATSPCALRAWRLRARATRNPEPVWPRAAISPCALRAWLLRARATRNPEPEPEPEPELEPECTLLLVSGARPSLLGTAQEAMRPPTSSKPQPRGLLTSKAKLAIVEDVQKEMKASNTSTAAAVRAVQKRYDAALLHTSSMQPTYRSPPTAARCAAAILSTLLSLPSCVL